MNSGKTRFDSSPIASCHVYARHCPKTKQRGRIPIAGLNLKQVTVLKNGHCIFWIPKLGRNDGTTSAGNAVIMLQRLQQRSPTTSPLFQRRPSQPNPGGRQKPEDRPKHAYHVKKRKTTPNKSLPHRQDLGKQNGGSGTSLDLLRGAQAGSWHLLAVRRNRFCWKPPVLHLVEKAVCPHSHRPTKNHWLVALSQML